MTGINISQYVDTRVTQSRNTLRQLEQDRSTKDARIYLPYEIERIRLATLLDIQTHLDPQ